MAFHIRNPETDRLARELARLKGIGLTEAVDAALREALKREEEKVPLREQVRDIVEEVASYADTGIKTDKAFFDDLSGI